MEPKKSACTPLSAELISQLEPDANLALPKVRQLYLALYHAVTNAQLPHGTQLPPSRELATRLSLGRNTVIAAYQQLCDEGLLRGDGRRGTVVVYHAVQRASKPTDNWRVSTRSHKLVAGTPGHRELAPGEPDTSLFPQKSWKQALQRASQLPSHELGYARKPLNDIQQSIARYLVSYRSLQVAPEQIIITASTRQSLLLAATLFADIGDSAWVESPGYSGAVDAFTQQGLTLRACPVDQDGLVTPVGSPVPKLIYVTPCFQYPAGVPLSASRRDALISFSSSSGAVIFEDDYDSEFRDDSQPRPALASMSESARVLHAGTFSKLMFPAVRLAWLVLPSSKVDAAQNTLRALGGGHNTVVQSAVAELLNNGTIAAHLQRARLIYAHRRQLLMDALTGCPLVDSSFSPPGSLSLVIRLNRSLPIRQLESTLNSHRLGAVPLERYQWDLPSAPRVSRALVLGLGNVDSLKIKSVVKRLNLALQEVA